MTSNVLHDRFTALYEAERSVRRAKRIQRLIAHVSSPAAKWFGRRVVLPRRRERGYAKLRLGIWGRVNTDHQQQCECYSFADYLRDVGQALRDRKIYLGDLAGGFLAAKDYVSYLEHLGDLLAGRKHGVSKETLDELRQEMGQILARAERRCLCR